MIMFCSIPMNIPRSRMPPRTRLCRKMAAPKLLIPIQWRNKRNPKFFRIISTFLERKPNADEMENELPPFLRKVTLILLRKRETVIALSFCGCQDATTQHYSFRNGKHRVTKTGFLR